MNDKPVLQPPVGVDVEEGGNEADCPIQDGTPSSNTVGKDVITVEVDTTGTVDAESPVPVIDTDDTSVPNIDMTMKTNKNSTDLPCLPDEQAEQKSYQPVGNAVSHSTSESMATGKSAMTEARTAVTMETVEVEIQDIQHGRQLTTYRHTGADDTSDSDSDSISTSSDSADEPENDPGRQTKDTQKNEQVKVTKDECSFLKVKGEMRPEDLPPLEELKITADEAVEMKRVGIVTSVVGVLAIIQGDAGLSPLDDNTVVFLENRQAIGQIFEVFGPVHAPWYSVRFNSIEAMTEMGVAVGVFVFCAPKEDQYTNYVFITQLEKIRGSDASWENDKEPPSSHVDYSDDEEERRAKAKNRNKNVEKKDGEENDEEAKAKLESKKNKRNANRRKQRGGHMQMQNQQQTQTQTHQNGAFHMGTNSQQGCPPRARGGFHSSNPFNLSHHQQQTNQFPRQPLNQWPPREPQLPVNQANEFNRAPSGRDSTYITEPRFQFQGQSGPPINRPMFRSPFEGQITRSSLGTEWNNNYNSFGTSNTRHSHPNNSERWNGPPRMPFQHSSNPHNFQTSGPNFNQSCPPRNNLQPSINRSQPSMLDNRLIQNQNTDNPPRQRYFNPTFGGQPQFDTRGIRPVPRLFNRDNRF